MNSQNTSNHTMVTRVADPPAAQPIPTDGTSETPIVARPVQVSSPLTGTPSLPLARAPLIHPATDRLAVASVGVGLFGSIVPIVGQCVGVGLGVAALVRIRGHRRKGIEAHGTGWALTGLLANGGILLGWVAAAAALLAISSSVATSSSSLHSLIAP